MANSTTTYWDINGVSLQTYAYNVTTWGGDLQSPPPLRGNDITIPYRPGEVFQARRPTGRTMTFNMWVIGADENGNIPSSMPMRQQFEANLRKLRNLFWNQGKQVTLTKRWKEGFSSTVYKASARAVFSGGFAPSMNGALRASFSVELYLSDPFFYGDDITLQFPTSASSTISPTILGDYETTALNISVNGARNNYRVTNLTEGIYVNVNQNIALQQIIRLDVNKWTATKSAGGLNTNVIGSVSNVGHEFWFVLRPGPQNLRLSSSTGTGSATISYLPRWL